MLALELLLALAAQISSTAPPSPARHGPVPSKDVDRFGLLVASLGDVDADGITDHAVTDANPFSGRTGPGRVWIFAGRDGHLLGKLEGEEARSSSEDPGRGPTMFGSALARLGDVDRDGCADFLVAAWAGARAFRTDPSRRRGYVRAYSGKDLHVLRELRSERDDDGFGCALDAADLDGDGCAEWIIGVEGSPDVDDAQVLVASGKDGRVTRKIASFAADRGRFGHSVAAVMDVDGDGRADLAIGAPRSDMDVEHAASGRVYVVSSSTGSLLRTLEGRRDRLRGEAAFGWTLARAGDLDHDEVPDFFVGCLDVYVRACSGRDGAAIADFDDHQPGGFAAGFAGSMCALSDLNGDDVPELAVGCEQQYDRGPRHDVTVYSGRTSTTLHVFDTGTSFANVANAGDVDGDGADDLLVGTWQQDRVVVYSGKTWAAIRTLTRPAR